MRLYRSKPSARRRHLFSCTHVLIAAWCAAASPAVAQTADEFSGPEVAAAVVDEPPTVLAGDDEITMGVTPRPTDLFPGLAGLIEAAQRQSPALLAELYGEDEAEANIDIVRSYKGFRVSATGRLQGQAETRINSDVTGDEFNIFPVLYSTATLPLYHWGEFDAKMELAKVRARLSRLSTARRAIQISQDVARYFVELQIARQAERLAKEGIEAAERRVNVQQAMVDSGGGAKRNLLEAKIYLQEREDDLIAAQNAVANYELVLRTLCGDPELDLPTAPFPDFDILSPETLSKLEYSARNPELMLAREAIAGQLEAEKAAYDELEARNKPKLDLVSSVYLDSVDEWSNNSYDTVPRVIGFVGVQATWQLYDNGEVRSAKRASLARQRRLDAQMEESRLSHERAVAALARDLELNARRLVTRRERLNLLEETVTFMEEQANAGVMPENDLLERMLELERTRVDLLRAKADYLLGVMALRSHAEPLVY